jgi:hypothetical protein
MYVLKDASVAVSLLLVNFSIGIFGRSKPNDNWQNTYHRQVRKMSKTASDYKGAPSDYMPLIRVEIQSESNNKVSTSIKPCKHFILKK